MGIWGYLAVVVVGGGLVTWFIATIRKGAKAEITSAQNEQGVKELLEMDRPVTADELKHVRDDFRRD